MDIQELGCELIRGGLEDLSEARTQYHSCYILPETDTYLATDSLFESQFLTHPSSPSTAQLPRPALHFPPRPSRGLLPRSISIPQQVYSSQGGPVSAPPAYLYFSLKLQAHPSPVTSNTRLAKPDKKSLHPDVLSDNSSAPLHNYLDEFLSAIRIFGFLEKPVS